MKKKLLSLLLVLVMVLGMFPMSAMAAEEAPATTSNLKVSATVAEGLDMAEVTPTFTVNYVNCDDCCEEMDVSSSATGTDGAVLNWSSCEGCDGAPGVPCYLVNVNVTYTDGYSLSGWTVNGEEYVSTINGETNGDWTIFAESTGGAGYRIFFQLGDGYGDGCTLSDLEVTANFIETPQYAITMDGAEFGSDWALTGNIHSGSSIGGNWSEYFSLAPAEGSSVTVSDIKAVKVNGKLFNPAAFIDRAQLDLADMGVGGNVYLRYSETLIRFELNNVTAQGDMVIDFITGDVNPAFTPVLSKDAGDTTENAVSAPVWVGDAADGSYSLWMAQGEPIANHYFDYVQAGEVESTRVSADQNSKAQFKVTEEEQAWTAYFGKALPILSATEGALSTSNPAPFYLGDTVSAYITFRRSDNNRACSYPISYTVKDSDGTVLADGEGTVDLSNWNTTANVNFSFDANETVTKDGIVNVEYVLGDNEASGSPQYTLSTCDKAMGEMSLTYLETSTYDMYSAYGLALEQDGSPAYDAVSYRNGETGEITTYLATMGGVHKYDMEGNMSFMAGMRNEGYGEGGFKVFGIGGPNEDDLAAFVFSDLHSKYLIYTYDAENDTWVANEGSIITFPIEIAEGNMLQSGDMGVKAKLVYVAAADDIYVSTTNVNINGNDVYRKAGLHWNGEEWSAFKLGDYATGRFEKAPDGTAYTAAGNKIYKYNGESWNEVTVTGITNDGTLQQSWIDVVSSSGSALYVKNIVNQRLEGYYAINLSTGAATKVFTNEELEGTTPADNWGSFDSKFLGSDIDGNLYATNSRGTRYTGGDTSGMFGSTAYQGGLLFKLTDGKYIKQRVDGMPGLNPESGYCITAEYVTEMFNTLDCVTVFTGNHGANYMLTANRTITFNTLGGSAVAPITAPIGSTITPPAAPTWEGYTFAGWYLSPYDTSTAYVVSIMPADNLTVYARWIRDSADDDDGSGNGNSDVFAADRARALSSLDEAFARLTQTDYSASEWAQVQSYYSAGKTAINSANTYDGIYNALNTAIANMQSVPASNSGKATVAISVELFTLDRGYIVEPVLVEVDKYEQVSVILTEQLKKQFPDVAQPWKMTGSVTSSFYLSYVWDGNDWIGEFDNGDQSGWMYSVNNNFPGVGADGSNVVYGDVIRWQYTCSGRGADLGTSADWVGGNVATVANKDALTWKVAEINTKGDKDDYGDAYTNAMAVLTNHASTQAEVDAALAALNAGSGGSGTPGGAKGDEEITVPISGDENTIHVGATVEGTKATIDEVDLTDLNKVVGDQVDTGTVTIDFSGLESDEAITTVELPADTVKKIAEAVNDPANDAHSLEIVLSDGASIEFDAAALKEKASQAKGEDITISIFDSGEAKLTGKQTQAVGNRPAYDINVTSGGKHISDMGGNITVHAPYELKSGEKARGIVVYYVDDNGNRERCETSYDPIKKRVNWKTDHLSLYMIDYDETLANNPFADVTEDAYYFDAVLWAVDKGITNGTSATTFSPDASCTRAQMVTFLWRAAGSPKATATTCIFTDVDKDAYYYEALLWAVESGITNGTSATTFSPDASCTRGQMATFLYRNAKTPSVSGNHDFTDVKADAYYNDAVIWAADQKITNGTSDTTFSPDADCTRGQMVTFLYRYLAE